jgi:transcriptional regulator of arginine metabolism
MAYRNSMTIAAQLHKLLSQGISGNQSRLVEVLARHGVKTTQSSVSRALKKINAVKGVGDNGSVVYSLPRPEPASGQAPYFESLVEKIQHNHQMILIHTRPGTANTVAKFIDDHNFAEVMGTVAGDDTIIIVPADTARTQATAKIVEVYLKKIGLF